MNSRKIKPSLQFDLPIISAEAFNLAGEIGEDGERLRREKELAAKSAREAKEIEQKQQSNLI